MAIAQPAPGLANHSSPDPLINDFSIVAATVNGSGSQTANLTLIRALFKMGIPVNGKNLFPSNISGLPTWFTIRLSKDGYVARRDDYEILVAMNPATQAEDIEKLAPDGLCLYPVDWKIKPARSDVTYYPLPTKALAKASGADAKLQDYMANMAYVGALAELLGIDMAEIENALKQQLKNKAKAVALNFGVVQAGAEHVRNNFAPNTRLRVARMNATTGKVLIEGNAAAALGAIFNGVTVAAWYPITPSTSVIDNLRAYADQFRTDPATGETTCAIIQAEDELAAIGMVIGAGWAGARALTATSGPGISLMGEFVGLGYFSEVPAVIWDIQRMGPSTGLPTRVSQGDVLKTYFLGHGDSKHVSLLPGTMAECFEFAGTAFDLAEQLQTPVFVLSDLDLGMNLWMTEPFAYPEQPLQRGKVLDAEQLTTHIAANQDFGRYRDLDGDGIGYRTLPGTEHPHAAYFSRGTGHDEHAIYSERPDVWETNLKRLARKHETARTLVPVPIEEVIPGATIGIISYGSNDPAIIEARDLLAEHGFTSSYLRIRALPLTESVREFVERHDHLYVIENNFDGQMAQLIQLDLPDQAGRIVPLPHCDGLPLTARWITNAILEQEH
ncbi:MAG: 2-oxoacid:acceptor oxidoreductase subunit alpha [Aggregatilineales bacterium]